MTLGETHSTEYGPSQKVRGPGNMAWLIFMDWVISWANEREGYFTEIMVIWERSGDFQELGHCSLFDL